MFVEVCDVFSAVRADCFGADIVTHCALITGDLSEGAVSLSLPEDPVAVHLQAHVQLLLATVFRKTFVVFFRCPTTEIESSIFVLSV